MPVSSFRTQLADYIAAAEKQGWEVTHTRRHWRFKPADPTKRIVFTASSPSDWRVLKNMRAELRRSGLEI